MSKDQKKGSILNPLSTSLQLSESCSEAHLKNRISSASSLYSMDTSLTLSDWLTLLQPILQKYLDQNQDPDTPVVQKIPPTVLLETLKLSHQPCKVPQLVELIRLTLDYSVRTSHPLFLDKLYSGVSVVGVISELVTAILNANTHVYHVSPVATVMEKICIQRLIQLISYPSDQSTGLMCPGGATSNLVAMCTARNHLFPNSKKEGMAGIPPLVVLTSEQAHFSICKAAMVLGIGDSHVITVKCNGLGQMCTVDLEKKLNLAISKGWTPFFIAATSGTTVLAAFDPLYEIASIARQFKCWFHVDGSYGGAFLFSPDLKNTYLSGLELSDSFVMNPHKLLGVPLQCSCLLVKLPMQTMKEANQSGVTDYLYHHHGTNNLAHLPMDVGELGLGCGRRADSLKWYFCWQAQGDQGFASNVEWVMHLHDLVDDWLHQQPQFKVLPTMGPTLCFWFLPPLPWGTLDPTDLNDERVHSFLHSFTIDLRTQMVEKGQCMIDYATVPSFPAFFRVPIHPKTQFHHLQQAVQQVKVLGNQLWETKYQGKVEFNESH